MACLFSIKVSLFFIDPFGLQQQFSGFANFFGLVQDPAFKKALSVSFILALAITVLSLSFGSFLAYLVYSRQKSQWVYKSLLLWPYAVAPAIAAILWRFLCQPGLGWCSQLFHFFHIEFNYLIHPWQALLVVILTASWQQLSYNFLFLFVAMKAIPLHLLEAATLDGATNWRKFWTIMLPLLAPTQFYLLMTNLIYSLFDTFGIIDILTNGGPGYSTTTLMYKIYKDGFVGMDLGGAASQSVILMLCMFAMTLFQFRFFDKRIHY